MMTRIDHGVQDIVDNRGGVFPLSSEQLLNVLDEASERNFLCGEQPLAVQKFVSKGDAGKIGLEDKNLVASLGFIVEQTLVNFWISSVFASFSSGCPLKTWPNSFASF